MAHRLLLADDSLTIQKVVELTFSDSDFELLTVGAGDKAVQALAGFNPDIVLADAVMPGLSGYEVCEAVKRLPHGSSIPVILLTGTFEPFDRARAERAGCDVIVTKPFDSHALLAQVKDLVQKAHAAREAAQTVTMQAFTPEPAPSFDDLDADRPDALYATTALRIPTPEELERIAREEAELKSMAASADATPLFQLDEATPAAFPQPGSVEAMAYETTAPLPPPEAFASAAPPFEEAPVESEAEAIPEALEVAEPVEEEAAEEAAEKYDATLPMGGPIAAPESWGEPAAFPAEMSAPAVEPVAEEPAAPAFEAAPFAEASAAEPTTEPIVAVAPPAETPFAEAAAPVEPEPFAEAPVAEPKAEPLAVEAMPVAGAAPTEEPAPAAEPAAPSPPVFTAEPAFAEEPAFVEEAAFAEEPSAAELDEQPIVVEPLVEESMLVVSEEAVQVPEPEPLLDVSSSQGIVLEPLVSTEEEPFGEEEAAAPPARPPRADLGTGEEPFQGDVEEAIAAYERTGSGPEPAFFVETPVDDEELGVGAPKEAEVSELEALAAGARLDDLKRLIPSAASGMAPSGLSPDQVDAIARRVVELLGERIVREVAWEVVPEMAERLVRARLREIEGA